MIRKEKFFIFLDGPVPVDRRYIVDMTDMELLFWSHRKQKIFFDEPDGHLSCRRAYTSDLFPVARFGIEEKLNMSQATTGILYPNFYEKYRYLL